MSAQEAGVPGPDPEVKNILLLTSSYPAAGNDGRAAAGFFVRDFAFELSALCRLNILTQQTGEDVDDSQGKKFSVTRFPWRGKSRPLSTLALPGDLLQILSVLLRGTTSTIRQTRRLDIDHVVAMWALPCGLWAFANRLINGTPYTVWCLGSDIWNYQGSRLVRPLLSLVLRKASRVFADGYELTDEVNRIADVGCSYLPSTRKFSRPGKKKPLQPDGVRHYLFVGRYHRHKGPDILVTAVQRLSEECRQAAHFHFFGGGPLRAELEAMVSEYGLEDCITLGEFIGESELVDMLAAADAVIIPSRKETISLMISAALQVDKAIIAADVGDMGYVLKKYEAGLIVTPESPAALAGAIEKDLRGGSDFRKGRRQLLATLDLSVSAAGILDSAR